MGNYYPDWQPRPADLSLSVVEALKRMRIDIAAVSPFQRFNASMV